MIEHLHALAVHAYYCGERDAGMRASERLLRHELPGGMEPVVRRNRTWYTQRLDELVDARYVRLDVETNHQGWSLFNPSILPVDGGFVCNVRSSNYRIVDGRYEMPAADNGVIRTENMLLHLDEFLHVTAVWYKLECEYETTAYPVDGLEDVRLNRVDGLLTASATVRNFAPLDGTCRIATAEMRPDAYAFSAIRCHATADGRHEKNWMPITGRAEWLYSCNNAGRVATVRDAGDAWLVENHAPAPHLAAGFRGGSQLVNVGGSLWLALVHEVAEDAGRRIYEHRFVQFDEAADWAITGISMPFAFRETRAIEFAAGLARHGERLVASFGVRDADAYLVDLNLRQVLGLLRAP